MVSSVVLPILRRPEKDHASVPDVALTVGDEQIECGDLLARDPPALVVAALELAIWNFP